MPKKKRPGATKKHGEALAPATIEKRVAELRKAGRHGYISVGGTTGALLLQVTPSVECWVLRYTAAIPNPKTLKSPWRRDHGLGVKTVANGLKEARVKAQAVLDKIKDGIDPITERAAARSARRAAELYETTFESATDLFLKDQVTQGRWKHGPDGEEPHTAAQYRQQLTDFVFPFIRQLRVRDVEQAHVVRILKQQVTPRSGRNMGKTGPLFNTMRETFDRVQERLAEVLNWSAQHGYRDKNLPNPAAWKGALEFLFKSSTGEEDNHHPALPHKDMPRFMAALRSRVGMSMRGLEFQILTATRAGDVLGAKWGDLEDSEGEQWTPHSKHDPSVWRIPPGRERSGVKTKGEHIVPLSPAAVALLKSMPRLDGTDLIFPAPRSGKRMHTESLNKIFADLHEFETRHGRKGFVDPRETDVDGEPRIATGHGTRSTFSQALADLTDFDHEAVEHCLAHQVGSDVRRAYQRSTVFKKRREVMNWYADFIGGMPR